MQQQPPERRENEEEARQGATTNKLGAFRQLGRRLLEVPPEEVRAKEREWQENRGAKNKATT